MSTPLILRSITLDRQTATAVVGIYMSLDIFDMHRQQQATPHRDTKCAWVIFILVPGVSSKSNVV